MILEEVDGLWVELTRRRIDVAQDTHDIWLATNACSLCALVQLLSFAHWSPMMVGLLAHTSPQSSVERDPRV